MSIQSIEDDPLNPDTVNMVDPNDGDEAGDQEYADPRLLDAITHIPGQSANREWGEWLSHLLQTVEEVASDNAGIDLDAVITGTRAHPMREVDNSALRVRQIPATNFSAYQFVIPANIAQQVGYYRPERTQFRISNTGAGSVFLGSSQAACAFEIKSGTVVTLDATCDMWLRADGTGSTVSVLDLFSTEIDSQ